MSRGVLFFAATAVLTLAVAGPASGRPLVTSLTTIGADPTSAGSYERIRGTGATQVVLTLAWRNVAPAGARKPSSFQAADPDSPDYNWESFDTQLKLAVASGLVPIVRVESAPAWAEGAGTGPPGTVRPSPTELGTFLTAAARRYSGCFPSCFDPDRLPRIRYWQIWNEPSGPSFLSPQYENGRLVSPRWYRAMLNRSYAALKAVDRSNVVLTGGLFAFEKRGWRPGPMRFMRDLLCMSKGPPYRRACRAVTYFDVWVHHPYACGGPNARAVSDENIGIAELPKMRRLLNAAVRTGNARPRASKRFWVTEWSWDTRPPDPLGVPLSLHARYVSEGLYRMWRGGITSVTWFQLVDQPLRQSIWQSGLYFRDLRPKQRSLAAFRFPFVAFAGPGRIRVWGRVPPHEDGRWRYGERVVVERKTAAGWRRLRTLRTNGNGIFRLTFRTNVKKGWLRARAAGGRATSDRFSLARPREPRLCPFGTLPR